MHTSGTVPLAADWWEASAWLRASRCALYRVHMVSSVDSCSDSFATCSSRCVSRACAHRQVRRLMKERQAVPAVGTLENSTLHPLGTIPSHTLHAYARAAERDALSTSLRLCALE